jgi:hypothetical protein
MIWELCTQRFKDHIPLDKPSNLAIEKTLFR